MKKKKMLRGWMGLDKFGIRTFIISFIFVIIAIIIILVVIFRTEDSLSPEIFEICCNPTNSICVANPENPYTVNKEDYGLFDEYGCQTCTRDTYQKIMREINCTEINKRDLEDEDNPGVYFRFQGIDVKYCYDVECSPIIW